MSQAEAAAAAKARQQAEPNQVEAVGYLGCFHISAKHGLHCGLHIVYNQDHGSTETDQIWWNFGSIAQFLGYDIAISSRDPGRSLAFASASLPASAAHTRGRRTQGCRLLKHVQTPQKKIRYCRMEIKIGVQRRSSPLDDMALFWIPDAISLQPLHCEVGRAAL